MTSLVVGNYPHTGIFVLCYIFYMTLSKFKNKQIKKWKGITDRNDVEYGFWQFCLDHAVRFDEKTYRVMFMMSPEKRDLLRRVYARATGTYNIEKDEAFYKNEKKIFEQFIFWKNQQESVRRREMKISKLPKIKRGIILFLRRLVNTLINKWITKNQ